jgi:hypothetical protein
MPIVDRVLGHDVNFCYGGYEDQRAYIRAPSIILSLVRLVWRLWANFLSEMLDFQRHSIWLRHSAFFEAQGTHIGVLFIYLFHRPVAVTSGKVFDLCQRLARARSHQG